MFKYFLQLFFTGLLLLTSLSALGQQPKAITPEKSSISAAHEAEIQALTRDETSIHALQKRLNTHKKFTDSTLQYYRSQLITLQNDLNNREATYKATLVRAKEFSEEFNASPTFNSNNSQDTEQFQITYDDFYIEKVKAYKQQISFIQGRLLQIKILQYEINLLLKHISKLQIAIYNGGVWNASHPFYLPATWKSASQEFVTYTYRLINQLQNTQDSFLSAIKSTKFWVEIVFLIFICVIYFMYLIKFTNKLLRKKFSDRNVRSSYLFIFDLIIKGILPAIAVLVIRKWLLILLGIQETPLLLSFITSLGGAVAAFLLLREAGYAYCNYCVISLTPKTKKKVTHRLTASILLLALILFVNNINFFGLNTGGSPFYPAQSIALINLFLGILLFFTITSLLAQISAKGRL